MFTSIFARKTCSLFTANCCRPRPIGVGCFRPVRHGDMCSFINGELITIDHTVGAGGARDSECDSLSTTELGGAQRHGSRVHHGGSPPTNYFGCFFNCFRFVKARFCGNGLRHFFYFRCCCRGRNFRFTRSFLHSHSRSRSHSHSAWRRVLAQVRVGLVMVTVPAAIPQ